MGNLHASSSPPPLVPNPTPPQSTETTPVPQMQSEASMMQPTTEQFPNNPGPMDDLHKKSKEVFPMIFEGARLMVTKGLSSHFQVAHTLTMSTTNPAQSGYKFGATFVGTKQIGPGEAYPIMIGDIDPNGNVNANVIHQFTPRILGKLMYRIQSSKLAGMQASLDYSGNDFTASTTCANIDLANNSGVIVCHYLQSVAKHTAVGAELAYQYGPNVPGYHAAVLNAAARYSCEDFTFSGTIGNQGIHTCYYQKCSDTVQVGVELETNMRVQESVATLGYQVNIPKSNFVFKGMIDSSWTVGAVIEKKLLPLPFGFSLSGSMNHRNSQFRLGCGFVIG